MAVTKSWTVESVLNTLEELGSAQTKKTLQRHGAPEPLFGVKIGDLKKVQKQIGRNHELALDLYATGNSDAMYLAGLIAEPERMSKRDLQRWAKNASWPLIGETIVAGTAAESRFGWDLGCKWIDARSASVAGIGWSTLGVLATIAPDEQLNVDAYATLLDRVANEIHSQSNRLRYTMNGFVIAVGSCVRTLHGRAKVVAEAIGPVEVDMGLTACQVPDAMEYLRKIDSSGRVGRKRKAAIC